MKDKIYSIIKRKCLRSQQPDFFEGFFFKRTPKKKFTSFNLQSEREADLFQGTYYGTYALGVVTILVFGISSSLIFPDAEFTLYMWVALSPIIILTSFIYSLSKIIWVNMFFYKTKSNSSNKIIK